MTRNLGGYDQSLRALAGAALTAYAATRGEGRGGKLAMALGIASMASAASGYCPLNQALGRDTSCSPGSEPTTRSRVTRNTPQMLNARLSKKLRASVDETVAAGPYALEDRLRQLEQEWDVERAIEVHAACAALFGLLMGSRVDERFYGIPAMIAVASIVHSLQGWYPLLLPFRAVGFRTSEEILAERNLLKAGRGDYRRLEADTEQLLAAVRL